MKPTKIDAASPTTALEEVLSFYRRALPESFVWTGIYQEQNRTGPYYTVVVYASQDRHDPMEKRITLTHGEGASIEIAARKILTTGAEYEVKGAIADAVSGIRHLYKSDDSTLCVDVRVSTNE